ncbi:hypothetical protein ACFYXS_04515 [Streptomyces sp. NPDC002574]|uniref:hypothetical protein n=1 Tax=Streptomyces sp. NPDC002574 TaxID=3364652 RepID=UPI0036C062C2
MPDSAVASPHRDPLDRPASGARATAEWTFRSAHVAGDTKKWLPLSAVRFTPALGTAGTVSYDDGSTWRPVKAVGGRRLVLRHPRVPAPSRCA